jgi:FkbM family methyltransferase
METRTRPCPFTLLATGHGSLIVSSNDMHILPDGRGYGVGFQLFNTGHFDPLEMLQTQQLLSLCKQTRGNGIVVLDGGANIGAFTIEWSKWMTGWGQVIAVEAQERLFYALAGNIAINNCFNAKAIHAALGAQNGTLKIPQPDYFKKASLGSLELQRNAHRPPENIGQNIQYDEHALTPVNMVAIDHLNLPRLDFLKIDVEGMELDVLDGACQTIDRHKPIIHTEWIKTPKEALIEWFKIHNYQYFEAGINLIGVAMNDPILTLWPAPSTNA